MQLLEVSLSLELRSGSDELPPEARMQQLKRQASQQETLLRQHSLSQGALDRQAEQQQQQQQQQQPPPQQQHDGD